MLSDVPFNWRKAKSGSKCVSPTIKELSSVSTIPLQTGVFLPWGIWGDDVIMLRDWLLENTNGKSKIYARYEWIRKQFETTIVLIGLTFKFADQNELIHFKLRWR